MNITSAKINMIKQQLRPAGILDEALLSLFTKVPREQFTPEPYQDVAYCDTMIPLERGEVMLSPVLEAKIIDALAIKPTDKILEIGTGSGYLTALLALKGHHVYSVDAHDTYHQQIKKNLKALEIHNVSLQINPKDIGWDKGQPYDVIVITGSMDHIPKNYLKQLTIGGRMFVVINNDPAMHAYLVTRQSDNAWAHKRLFETAIPPLINASKKSEFEF